MVRVVLKKQSYLLYYMYVCQGCVLAPDLVLCSLDYVMRRTVAHRFLGASLGEKRTDFDFADDAAILAEMMAVLILGLEILNIEAREVGLEINWQKTKV